MHVIHHVSLCHRVHILVTLRHWGMLGYMCGMREENK